MILVIDNYDSFTFNLVQALGALAPDAEIRVCRNDELSGEEARRLAPTHLIVSPGPCSPAEAGASNEIIAALAGRVPILGVCLGHQCIGALHGMRVCRAARPVHGLPAWVRHDGRGIFAGLPSPFEAARYHSLVVELDGDRPPPGWEVSAVLDVPEGERPVVMGLRRVWSADDGSHAPLDGVQFHPESFLTPEGPRLLANFLRQGSPPQAPTARPHAAAPPIYTVRP